ncbi:MAG: S8 family serine peptidase [Myxococcota bacterium]
MTHYFLLQGLCLCLSAASQTAPSPDVWDQLSVTAKRSGLVLLRADRSSGDRWVGISDRIVVLVDRNNSLQRTSGAAARAGYTVERLLPELHAILLRIPSHSQNQSRSDKNDTAAVAELSRLPGVVDVTPDWIIPSRWELRSFEVSSPPRRDDQWHHRALCTPSAHRISRGRPTVTIAVIDDGFDLQHDQFGLTEFHPAPYDFLDDDFDPSGGPNDAHGTAVAGLIFAFAENRVGISGVCPRCTFLPIRKGVTSSADAQAIMHAVNVGADVINCSWGYPNPHPVVERALNDAFDRGVFVVFAAGNDGVNTTAVNDVSTLNTVFAVSATDETGLRLATSSYGETVAFAAPGSELLTLDRTDGGYTFDHYHPSFTGTSGATALISASAGLVLSLDASLEPYDIESSLCRAANTPASEALVGCGIVNLGRALSAIQGQEFDPARCHEWPEPTEPDSCRSAESAPLLLLVLGFSRRRITRRAKAAR